MVGISKGGEGMSERVLHMTLKRKWFDMIASNEKLEEYGEVKRYWIARLLHIYFPVEDEVSGCSQ